MAVEKTWSEKQPGLAAPDTSEDDFACRESADCRRPESFDRLLAYLQHEVNNVLAPTGAFVEMLLREVTSLHDILDEYPLNGNGTGKRLKKTRQLISDAGWVINSAAERVFDINQWLRGLYRPNAVPFEAVDINSIIEDTLKLVAPTLGPNISIKKHFGECREVSGNPGQLRQVFQNILKNAHQAIGGIGVITIATRVVDKTVQATISDSGPGIATEDYNRIFEPGYTLRPNGSGLGLAICRQIVEAHRGSIEVFSEPGSGASFGINLPV